MVLGGFVIWQQTVFAGHIFPRTYAANTDVGLQETDALSTILAEQTDSFARTFITVRIGDSEAVLTPSALGLTFDLSETMTRIPVITPGESPVTFFEQWILSKSIPLVWTIDEPQFRKTLAAVFPKEHRAAQDATLTWTNDHVTVVPELIGIAFDDTIITKELLARAENLTLSDLVISVPTESVAPTIFAENLENDAVIFEDQLGQTITFIDGAREKEVVFKDHPSWWYFTPTYTLSLGETTIPLEMDDAFTTELASIGILQKGVSLHIKEDVADKELLNDMLAPGFEIAPQDVTITQNDDGTITFEGDGQNGRWIMRKSFFHSLEIALNEGIQTVTLPMYDVAAKVHTTPELEALGIKELLAVGYSTFRGSPINRMHNIAVGIAKFNGVIIPQGAEFSVGDTLGYVGASTGYLPELVIKEGEILPEYGGGLCQISSTIFRGVLFTGLPITQRKAHSYAVAYYALPLGYGLDATVYPPQVDLKFMNDTPGALLIQSFVKGKEVYVKMYGTSDGRIATLDGPYISNRRTDPQTFTNADALPTGITQSVNTVPGVFTAVWNRLVTYGDGKVSEDTFTSVYGAPPPHKDEKKED